MMGNNQHDPQQPIDGTLAELNEVLRTLISSAETSQADCAALASDLQQIEEVLRSAHNAEELRAAKTYLTNALDRLREQNAERKKDAARLLTSVRDRLARLPQPCPADPQQNVSVHSPAGAAPAGRASVLNADFAKLQFDSITGLSGSRACEAAILALKPAERHQFFIATFHVTRMEAVKERFGEKFSNEVLLFCAQQIGSVGALSGDTMFRWAWGFVAISKRECSLIEFRQEIGRALPPKMTFESRDGSVLLPISVTTSVMHASEYSGSELIAGLKKLFLDFARAPAACVT